MGMDPNAPAPSKYGDFATRPRTDPQKASKAPKDRPDRGPSRRPSKRWLAGIAAVAVVAAAAGFFAFKPGDDSASSNRGLSRRGAAGSLAGVKGSTLTLRSGPGASVKVTTSKATAVTKAVPGALADIKVGDNVVVTGVPTGPDAISAERVVVNNGAGAGGRGPFAGSPGGYPGEPMVPGGRSPGLGDPGIGGGSTAGRVESVNQSGFVVSGGGFPPVSVAVGEATVVSVFKTVTLKELTIGQPVVVSGATKDDGTVAATSVQQGSPGFGPGPRPDRPGRPRAAG